MVLHHVGILQKGGCLASAKGSEPTWRIAESKREVEHSVKKIMQDILGWCTVRQVIRRAPWTCSDWHNLQRSAFLALKALRMAIPRLPAVTDRQYVLGWTLPTLMLMRVEREGAKNGHG